MRTHRFGRKLRLPSTMVIKHQLRKLMAEDALKVAELEAMEAIEGARAHLTQIDKQIA